MTGDEGKQLQVTEGMIPDNLLGDDDLAVDGSEAPPKLDEDGQARQVQAALDKLKDERDQSPETFMARLVRGTEAMIENMDKRRVEYIDALKADYQVELDRSNAEIEASTVLLQNAMQVAQMQSERIKDITALNAKRAAEVEKLVHSAETTFSKMIAGQRQAIAITTAAKEGE